MQTRLMIGKLFLTVISFTVLSACTHAQPTTESADLPAPSVVPHGMMAKLAVLEGRWLMTTAYTEDNGETWTETPEVVVSVDFEQKGMMLTERPEQFQEGSFNMVSFITYDQYREEFRKAAIDDIWGVMDLYNGGISGDTLVLHNLDSDTSFPIDDERWRHFRITVELKDETRQMIIDASEDAGLTWHPSFVVTYKRIN